MVITGGSRGIGLGLARKFLAEGNEVLIIARDPERLARAAADEPGFRTFTADLARAGDIADAAGFIAREFAGVNVLINNAGTHYPGDLADDVTAEQVITEVAVNVTAPVLLTQKLLPLLRRNAPGAVVNVSSTLGFAPKRSATVYGASKAFVQNFSRALRYQQEARGVRVFDLIPPAVDTDMMAGRAVSKIQPAELADAFWLHWLGDEFDAPIGKARFLKRMFRLSPDYVRRKLRDI